MLVGKNILSNWARAHLRECKHRPMAHARVCLLGQGCCGGAGQATPSVMLSTHFCGGAQTYWNVIKVLIKGNSWHFGAWIFYQVCASIPPQLASQHQSWATKGMLHQSGVSKKCCATAGAQRHAANAASEQGLREVLRQSRATKNAANAARSTKNALLEHVPADAIQLNARNIIVPACKRTLVLIALFIFHHSLPQRNDISVCWCCLYTGGRCQAICTDRPSDLLSFIRSSPENAGYVAQRSSKTGVAGARTNRALEGGDAEKDGREGENDGKIALAPCCMAGQQQQENAGAEASKATGAAAIQETAPAAACNAHLPKWGSAVDVPGAAAAVDIPGAAATVDVCRAAAAVDVPGAAAAAAVGVSGAATIKVPGVAAPAEGQAASEGAPWSAAGCQTEGLGPPAGTERGIGRGVDGLPSGSEGTTGQAQAQESLGLSGDHKDVRNASGGLRVGMAAAGAAATEACTAAGQQLQEGIGGARGKGPVKSRSKGSKKHKYKQQK
eukprot:1161924-Pelagomonas_calceolata.AAC.6